MFREKNIPKNFNGKIFLGDEEYFFNVNNAELRIFYNKTGISTAREFRDEYRIDINRGLLYGECPDKKRVAFLLDGENYSSYPDRYSEFRLIACIKEGFYLLKTAFGQKASLCEEGLEKHKLENFDIYDTVRISGDLINAICSKKIEQLSSEESLPLYGKFSRKNINYVEPITIRLNPRTECTFSSSAILDTNIINGAVLNAHMDFSFDYERNLTDFYDIFDSVKRFVDFMAKARNTEFKITLLQKNDGEYVEFAEAKIYNNYNNICDKDFRSVINLDSVKENIPSIFKNLCDEKYSLLFLPMDNNDYDTISYTDIQNLSTVIEMASELDKKYIKVYPKPKNEKIAKEKAKIIFEWCKKYAPVINRTQPQNKGWDEPFYYELTANKIEYFRRVRNDIAHRATGRLDLEVINCFVALRSVLYYYIMDFDENSDIKLRI